jgi:trimethylamine---corrinoid protein Co-methyltransferase
MTIIRPQITVLNAGQIAQIHERSLQILSTVGVRVDSEAARQVFVRAIGRPADGDRVRIPRELVERALSTAPPAIDVYDRRGDFAFRLGSDLDQAQEQARFGIGVTALYYQDPETDDVTPFARRHMAQMVRLGNALDSFDLISTVGIVQDVPPEWSDLYATLEMVANTVKPLSILISDEARYLDVLDLIGHLHGDLAARPFVIPYFNPITPLVMNEGTTDKMRATIERGLPFMYSNYGMVGATTPITPASALVLLNAELLAGLTFSQLLQAGAPVILGCLPAFFDMQGMGSFYDAQSYLINLACAEMMAHYRLPHCGTSGSGMGWGADLIAGGHQWVNHLTSCMGKIGLAPFVGDNLDSKAFSPAIVIYADEIIAQARRLVQGFPLDEDTLALHEIEQAGPGGNYLTSDLTLERFRDAYFRSDIWPNLTFEEWQEQGHPQPTRLLRRYARELLDRLAPPEDHADLMALGEGFIARLSTSI